MDILSSICLERVKNTTKILSKERRWKIEVRNGELPNRKHCWMAKRRYYLKYVMKKKSNQSLLLQAESAEGCSKYIINCGPGSSVGLATGYGLDSPGIESQWEATFSAPVQTSSGAHPSSCTMRTGSFPGVKSGQGVTLTPHPF